MLLYYNYPPPDKPETGGMTDQHIEPINNKQPSVLRQAKRVTMCYHEILYDLW